MSRKPEWLPDSESSEWDLVYVLSFLDEYGETASKDEAKEAIQMLLNRVSQRYYGAALSRITGHDLVRAVDFLDGGVSDPLHCEVRVRIPMGIDKEEFRDAVGQEWQRSRWCHSKYFFDFIHRDSWVTESRLQNEVYGERSPYLLDI
jgi:hypothetical protein